MEKVRKLNLGCGKDIREGYINLDKVKLNGVDVVHDLNKFPYPFKPNYFDEVYCDNLLEHLDNLEEVMREIYRILKVGGRLIVIVPYFSQVGAFSDPTHKRFFTYYTMDYFCGLRERSDFYYDFGFKIVKKEIKFLFEYKRGVRRLLLWIVYLLPWLVYKISPGAYVWFFSYIFPASEIYFELEK